MGPGNGIQSLILGGGRLYSLSHLARPLKCFKLLLCYAHGYFARTDVCVPLLCLWKQEEGILRKELELQMVEESVLLTPPEPALQAILSYNQLTNIRFPYVFHTSLV